MSDLRAMLKLEATDNSLTVHAWLPEALVTDCLARIAAAWVSRGCAPERPCSCMPRIGNDPGAHPCDPKVPAPVGCAKV